MQELKFENYNKIEDTMIFLGKNTVLKMNLNLYQKSEKMGRSSYHKEIMYFNETIGEKVVNIKRSFDFFMSIENLKPVNGEKQFIMIRQEDIWLFRKVLHKVHEFFSENFAEIFTKRGKSVNIDPNIKPIEYNGLPMNKYLIFTPDVTETISGQTIGCIRMNLSSPTNYVLMSLNKLSGLLESINNADMYLYAQNMSTYMGRPIFGSGLFDMTSRQEIEDQTIAVPGRKVQPKGSGKSYFQNKMTELEG